jgi:hypothetical protein
VYGHNATIMKILIMVFWVVTAYGFVDGYHHSEDGDDNFL